MFLPPFMEADWYYGKIVDFEIQQICSLTLVMLLTTRVI